MRANGTRELIFDEALGLISSIGYEKVNMREIASACGIRAPSIYNHFNSKQEILDTIYDYYEEHFFDNLKTNAEIQAIIKTGSAEEIVDAFAFTFESEDQKKYTRMVLTTKTIYSRNATDKRAASILFDLILGKTERNLIDLLNYGVKIGRFEQFDTATYAGLLLASRHMLGVKAFSKKDYTVSQLAEETAIKKMLAAFLPIKN